MSKREAIQKEISTLYQEGAQLAVAFQKKKEENFQYEYQLWYSKALRTVSALAPDRHAEFRGYYEVDPKRKVLGYGTYVIQDYIKGVGPDKFRYPDFDVRQQVLTCFFNQLTILKSIEGLLGNL